MSEPIRPSNRQIAVTPKFYHCFMGQCGVPENIHSAYTLRLIIPYRIEKV